jgi:hypothetical protein
MSHEAIARPAGDLGYPASDGDPAAITAEGDSDAPYRGEMPERVEKPREGKRHSRGWLWRAWWPEEASDFKHDRGAFIGRAANSTITIALAILAFHATVRSIDVHFDTGAPFNLSVVGGSALNAFAVAVCRSLVSLLPTGRWRIRWDIAALVVSGGYGLIGVLISGVSWWTYAFTLGTFLGLVVQDWMSPRK